MWGRFFLWGRLSNLRPAFQPALVPFTHCLSSAQPRSRLMRSSSPNHLPVLDSSLSPCPPWFIFSLPSLVYLFSVSSVSSVVYLLSVSSVFSVVNFLRALRNLFSLCPLCPLWFIFSVLSMFSVVSLRPPQSNAFRSALCVSRSYSCRQYRPSPLNSSGCTFRTAQHASAVASTRSS